MSDTLATLRDQLTKELAEADTELARLREAKKNLEAEIKARVAERDEVASAVSKLTRKPRAPRQPKPAAFAPVNETV